MGGTMRRLFNFLFSLLLICSSVIIIDGGLTGNFALADTLSGLTGTSNKTLYPAPSGNGRALAFDPSSTHLFYTNVPDPHIYVITNNGSPVATISPVDASGTPIQYGALAWDSEGGGILWGGRYDGSGKVDKINPHTGVVTPAFTFSFSSGETCYNQ